MAGSQAVTRFIAAHRDRITTAWCERVATITEAVATALLDQLHDFLVEHDPRHLRASSWRLAELAALREVLLTELLAHVPGDVTGIVAVNAALDVASREAMSRAMQQRDDLRERFVGVLGHDLRNPLMTLTLAAETILAQPCAQPNHARHALAIRNGGERMSRMIGSIADFAHGQLGGDVQVARGPCDMGSLCREVIDEYTEANPDRDIRLATEGQLAGAWDRDRVVQVISNLVANAIVHGNDPTTARVFATSDGTHVVTEVHNAGPPIAGDTLEMLFDPFRRVKSRRGGLGLGLYIVQQITHAHHADCTVDSTVEHGTTFRISWPRRDENNPDTRGTQHASR